jgi:hypothetical protein
MMGALLTIGSGWAALVLYCLAVAIPLVAKAMAGARFPGFWIHYVFGLLTPAVGFAHAWSVMRAGRMSVFNADGLWIATFALLASILQALLGLALRTASPQARDTMRLIHFLLMLALGGLIAAHVWLNRS